MNTVSTGIVDLQHPSRPESPLSIVKSVEISENCVSEHFLFYKYLKQGFLVNLSPFFKYSYFRVRYFNYDTANYWP